MSDCKCDSRTYMLGDGCEVCNPAKSLEYATETIDEQEAEIEHLRAEATRLSSMVDHQRDEAIETERMLRAELAHYKEAATKLSAETYGLEAELTASREREARMRALLQAADVLFAHRCRDCTALNWLDETRAALAEGAQG